MKTCHALQQVNGPVKLWVPESIPATWDDLASFYGLTSRFEVEGLPAIPIFRRYDLTLRSFYHARRWGADLVYTWNLQAAVLALFLNSPVILELHALPSGKFGPSLFRKFLNQRGKKRLLIITDALRKLLEDEYRANLGGDWVQIAPNGVDFERYENLPDAEKARKLLNLPDGITAGYTGHFYAGRGLEILLHLANKFPAVNFIWAGGNPEDKAMLEKRLSDEQIANVILTGFIPQDRIPFYQAAADILLMPYERSIAGSSGGDSADYCSPMKMFDYLAAGRPILTSDLPVIQEVLNNTNSIICPAEDTTAWQIAFQKLIQDPGLRGRLSSNARRDAMQYSWKLRAKRALMDW